MDRRTFVKTAAGITMLGAMPSIATSSDQKKMRPWPETVYFDNPIANGLFPLKFVEVLPLNVRGRVIDTDSFGKPLEIFRFTPREGVRDAVLFRGVEIKVTAAVLHKLYNRELHNSKISVHVDGYKVLEAGEIGTYMKEGGAPFPLHDVNWSGAVLCCTYRGWLDKDGFSYQNQSRFAGYFLPNETCLSVEIDCWQVRSIALEIKCDMARYSTKG